MADKHSSSSYPAVHVHAGSRTRYRIDVIGPDGALKEQLTHWFECDDDAVGHARSIGQAHEMDIWQDGRLVAQLVPSERNWKRPR